MPEMYVQEIDVPRVYTGQYGRMKFPKYQYHRYPMKMVKPDGTETAVYSQAEELALLASAQASNMPIETPLVQENISLAQEVAAKANEIINKDLELAELRAKLLELEAPPVSSAMTTSFKK